MELLKLSKFKLQIQSLISEVRDLRGRERLVSDQLHIMNQKQKQTEEEYSRKVQELQAELASSREIQEKLERKVSYLENDYVLLENKQKELKATTQNLLQSRESFLNAYQESFCEMKRSIEARDRKIAILYEKINSHLSLFDSIEKEALAIKKVIKDVHGVVEQKEDVAGLKEKMDHVSTFERMFIEKIRNLEDKLKNQETELQSKENIISELSAQLESVRIKNDWQAKVEEDSYLQKTLQAKDLVVENMISEKEALHYEVRSLERILQRIQESVSIMNEDDKRVFTSILTCQQGLASETKEDSRYNDTVHNVAEPPSKTPPMLGQENTGKAVPSPSPCYHNHTSDSNSLQEIIKVALPRRPNKKIRNDGLHKTSNTDHIEPELLCSSPDSTCSQHQPLACDRGIFSNNIFSNNHMGKHKNTLHQPDSECSTTQPSQNH